MLYEFAPFEGLRNGEIKFLCDLWIRDRQKFYAKDSKGFRDIPPRPQDLMPLWEYEALAHVLFIRTGLLTQVLLLPA